MKSILMKFADNVLSKNEMKELKGGYDAVNKRCGICYDHNGTQYGCSGGWFGKPCECGSGNSNNLCG